MIPSLFLLPAFASVRCRDDGWDDDSGDDDDDGANASRGTEDWRQRR